MFTSFSVRSVILFCLSYSVTSFKPINLQLIILHLGTMGKSHQVKHVHPTKLTQTKL